MSIRKLFLLQDVQLALDETLAEAIHPSGQGMSKRRRLRLLAESFADHLHSSVEGAKLKSRRTARRLAANAALLASHELTVLAGKIEKKAHAFRGD